MGLSIEAIAEQFITVGTKDYDLVIDITGDPDTVTVTGLPEGFYQDWDAANDQLHIKSAAVTRLTQGQVWDIELIKDSETLLGKVLWNAIQAAAILQTLPTLHLYKGVPLNFDILIHNIPPQVIPKTLLIGIKSELVPYGLNFKGQLPADADLTVTTDTLTIVLPASVGRATVTKNYAFTIESGSPPAIGTPTFKGKSDYGELTFTDVQHAFGYEWHIDRAGEENLWHFFNSDRPMINPSQVHVTPGTLSVTLAFPNIANASAYEYRLVSVRGETLWKRFTGTLSNNTITTIIPNLEEGVAYDLQLRVASPWVGTPITVKVYGGRLCYALNISAGSRTNHALYIFHTGHAKGTTIQRIKRLVLPATLTYPDRGGLAVKSNGDVLIANINTNAGGERTLYTFEASTIDAAADGARLTQDRKNPFAVINSDKILQMSIGMAEYNSELYAAFANTGTTNDWGRFAVMTIPSTEGATVTRARGVGYGDTNWYFKNANLRGISVDKDTIWYNAPKPNNWRAEGKPRPADRETLLAGIAIQLYAADGTTTDYLRSGLKVIGDTFYGIESGTDKLEVWRVNPAVHATRYVLDFELRLPTGLTAPFFLDMIA